MRHNTNTPCRAQLCKSPFYLEPSGNFMVPFTAYFSLPLPSFKSCGLHRHCHLDSERHPYHCNNPCVSNRRSTFILSASVPYLSWLHCCIAVVHCRRYFTYIMFFALLYWRQKQLTSKPLVGGFIHDFVLANTWFSCQQTSLLQWCFESRARHSNSVHVLHGRMIAGKELLP
jgi:hypothetical protein